MIFPIWFDLFLYQILVPRWIISSDNFLLLSSDSVSPNLSGTGCKIPKWKKWKLIIFEKLVLTKSIDRWFCPYLPSGENLFIDSTSFGSRRPFKPKPRPFLSNRFLCEIGYNDTSVRRFTTGNSSISCGKSKIVNQNKINRE